MNTSHAKPRLRQQGMVTAIAVIFLIVVLIFVLSQTLDITGSNSIDNEQQLDSVAALFLAESGLERGRGVLTSSAASLTDAVCTGIGSSFPLGKGTVTLSGTSTPAICDSSGATPCTSCVMRATGNVQSASRTLTHTMSLTQVNGTSCNSGTTDCTNATAPPPTWSMVLRNTYANTAIALFNLAANRQGNPSGAGCTIPQCALEWNINAQNGSNSVLDMGNAVTIPSAETYSIYQTLTLNRNLSEVGALFPGSGSGPNTVSIVGAYWDDTVPAGGGTKTVGRSADSNGQTNNGTATSSGSCTAPGPNSIQACTSWCYDGDTLVFGFGGNSTSLADQLSSVTFNTAGTPAQNIALSRVAKFPNPSIPGAPTDVYSEVWYAHNPNLSPTPIASFASSYKGNGTGAIGATFIGNISENTLTVTTFGAYPLSIISPGAIGTGDTLSGSGGANVTGNPTVLSQLTSTESGGALGGRGTYTISGSPQTVNNKTMTASSKYLHVTACTICFFAPGDPVVGTSYTINSQTSGTTGGVGDYLLNGTPANGANAASAAVVAGTVDTTIYLPSTSSMPTVTTPTTRIAKISGTGAFDANTPTTVTAVTSPDPNSATKSFTVSPAPTTPLNLATICAGTCAYFDHASATTTFTIAKTAGTDYWASGFMCLKGADITPIPITSSIVSANTWSEVVQ